MNKVIEELSKIGIVPVIALDDAKDAEPLAKALIEGGLPCAEVTFRTAAAEEAIKIMAEKFPELVVGDEIDILYNGLGWVSQIIAR